MSRHAPSVRQALKCDGSAAKVDTKDNGGDTPVTLMAFNRSNRTFATLIACGAEAPEGQMKRFADLAAMTRLQAAVVSQLPDLLMEKTLWAWR